LKPSDEKLHEYVIDLESGKPLEALLAGMPAEDQVLKPLVSLAATLRDAPDPATDPAVDQTQDSLVKAAIQRRAAYTPAVTTPSSNGHRPGPIFGLGNVPGLSVQQRLAGGMVFVLSLFLLAWILWPGSRATEAATLINVSGQVEVRDLTQTVGWRQIRRRRPGDRGSGHPHWPGIHRYPGLF
jgi:hypothetical protein